VYGRGDGNGSGAGRAGAASAHHRSERAAGACAVRTSRRQGGEGQRAALADVLGIFGNYAKIIAKDYYGIDL